MANLELSNLTQQKTFVSTSKSQPKVLDEKAAKLESLAEDVKAGKVSPEVLGKELGMTNVKASSEKGRINISFDFNGNHVALDAANIDDATEQLGDIMGDLIGNGDPTCKSDKKDSFGERFSRNLRDIQNRHGASIEDMYRDNEQLAAIHVIGALIVSIFK